MTRPNSRATPRKKWIDRKSPRTTYCRKQSHRLETLPPFLLPIKNVLQIEPQRELIQHVSATPTPYSMHIVRAAHTFDSAAPAPTCSSHP